VPGGEKKPFGFDRGGQKVGEMLRHVCRDRGIFDAPRFEKGQPLHTGLSRMEFRELGEFCRFGCA
jgi:hypothetical protein